MGGMSWHIDEEKIVVVLHQYSYSPKFQYYIYIRLCIVYAIVKLAIKKKGFCTPMPTLCNHWESVSMDFMSVYPQPSIVTIMFSWLLIDSMIKMEILAYARNMLEQKPLLKSSSSMFGFNITTIEFFTIILATTLLGVLEVPSIGPNSCSSAHCINTRGLLLLSWDLTPLREINLLGFLPQNPRQMKRQTINISLFEFKMKLIYERANKN